MHGPTRAIRLTAFHPNHPPCHQPVVAPKPVAPKPIAPKPVAAVAEVCVCVAASHVWGSAEARYKYSNLAE